MGKGRDALCQVKNDIWTIPKRNLITAQEQEIHKMKIHTVRAVSTVSIPLIVRYTCEYCGAENIDMNQKLTVKSESFALPYSTFPAEWQRRQASEAASVKMKELINSIQERKEYDRAGFNCVCSSCGKSPTWTSKVDPTGLALLLFIAGILLLFMISGYLFSSITVDHRLDATGFVLLSIAIAACIPQIIVWFKRAALRKQLAAIPDDKLPQLSVVINRKIV